MDPEAFGEQLLQLRTDLGLSQSEAARRSGVEQGSWSRIELGKTKAVSLNTAALALRGLGKTLTIVNDKEQS